MRMTEKVLAEILISKSMGPMISSKDIHCTINLCDAMLARVGDNKDNICSIQRIDKNLAIHKNEACA
jgi:hypothetical protein